MIKKITSDELLKGSIILFLTFNIFNVLNFIFQFLMARMLGPAEFGIFASLMTLLYFMALPSESIQTIISKYTSGFNSQKKYGKIKNLLMKSLRKGIIASLILFLALLPFFYTFSYFLKIPFILVTLSGLILFSFFLIPSTRGVMQGMKKFGSLGTNMILDSFIKVIIAVILVSIGFGVYGAIMGIILGGLTALFISFIPLKNIIKTKVENTDFSGIYKYGSPILFILLPILLMQSIDVFLARRFFSPESAGHYAVANLIGKMIFFGTLAISKTMFPISSEKFNSSNNIAKTSKIFHRSLIIVFSLCFFSLTILFFFPTILINTLFGREYLEISPIIFNIGLSFSFISFANLFLLYGLSVNKKISFSHGFSFVFFIIIQAGVLYYLKDNLINFSMGMVFSTLLLFIGSLIFVLKK